MSEKKPALWLRIYSIIVYGFIYAPILILIIFSFNTQKLNIRWEGFTLNWYKVLFNDAQIMLATRNTLLIAIISTLIATIIGTMAALAMHRYRFPFYNTSETVMYIPIVIPEVVMGISLLVFFVMINFTLGLTTITLSHIAFSIPFVALVVRARLHGYDKAIDEAAMDLGANEINDILASYTSNDYAWCVGWCHVGVNLILGRLCHHLLHCRTRFDHLTAYEYYSMVKTAVTPEINALSTIWVLIIFILLVFGQIAQRKKNITIRKKKENCR